MFIRQQSCRGKYKKSEENIYASSGSNESPTSLIKIRACKMCLDCKNATGLSRKGNVGKEGKGHSLRFIFYSIMEPILF